ncbi:MAG: pseudouridine synthase [bacterium]
MGDRLNKYLSACGHCSRRQADQLIAAGRVKINGRPATVGQAVGPDDLVEVDGRSILPTAGRTYLMVNKPVGVICTSDRQAKDNILDLVGADRRLFPVGRLDVESSGLLLLTDDGELTNRLTHPRYGHEKEYLVRLAEPITDADLSRLASGIELDGRRTLAADVHRQADDQFSIVIREGRNRQIRRMCEAIGHTVRTLKRIRVHTLSLGRLRPGAWRELTKQEIQRLKSEQPSRPPRPEPPSRPARRRPGHPTPYRK